jgi:DNA-binding transcriptional ArsR family regulator
VREPVRDAAPPADGGVVVAAGVLVVVVMPVRVAHGCPFRCFGVPVTGGAVPVRRVDVGGPLRHYVRMSARMHLSPADDAHPHTPGEEQFALAAEVLALLGDRTRLTLLHALTGGEADVTTLTEVCGAARPAVSQHLARLRLAGLVATRKEGRRVVYSLRDGHLRRLVDEALNVADHRLGDRPLHD